MSPRGLEGQRDGERAEEEDRRKERKRESAPFFFFFDRREERRKKREGQGRKWREGWSEKEKTSRRCSTSRPQAGDDDWSKRIRKKKEGEMESWPVETARGPPWGSSYPAGDNVDEESDWENDAQLHCSRPSPPPPQSRGTPEQSTSAFSSSSSAVPIASLDAGALHPVSLSVVAAANRRLRELVNDPLSDRELWKVRHSFFPSLLVFFSNLKLSLASSLALFSTGLLLPALEPIRGFRTSHGQRRNRPLAPPLLRAPLRRRRSGRPPQALCRPAAGGAQGPRPRRGVRLRRAEHGRGRQKDPAVGHAVQQ